MYATDPREIRELVDRVSISDTVIRHATSIDTRDWPLYRSCFADRVEIDYREFDRKSFGWQSADDWTETVRRWNAGFDATQHASSNHVRTIQGDEAICLSSLRADHFFREDSGTTSRVTLWCNHEHRLVRRDEGWVIQRNSLKITWVEGDMSVFDRALRRLNQAA